jgi:hypothetical protein
MAVIGSDELAMARMLREEVAPSLANGMACALRDQPADPAGYMAEYLVNAHGGGAARVLDQHRMSQECARLDAEIARLREQVDVARAERARRLPLAGGLDAQRDAAAAAASWSETRRLKRLIRSMKVKMGEPLSPSDWPMPEGVILVQGGRSIGSHRLCEQLSEDFDIGCVDAARYDNVGSGIGAARHAASSDALHAVLQALKERPTVLLHGFLDVAERSRELFERFAKRVGTPTAVLLLQCGSDEHAYRVKESDPTVGTDVAHAEAGRWASDIVTLEAAASEAHLQVARVDIGGEFDQQMTNLLVRCTSV